MNLKKYDISGSVVGEVHSDLPSREVSSSLIKKYVTVVRENQRQWSAHTQTRADVSHSGKKPHRQKGTGKARQGSLASPQFKGGGVVFGPRKKADQRLRLNRKERRAVMDALLSQKIKEGNLHIFSVQGFTSMKTSRVSACLDAAGWGASRVLFIRGDVLGEVAGRDCFVKSARNLLLVDSVPVCSLSGLDLLRASVVLVEDGEWERVTRSWRGCT